MLGDAETTPLPNSLHPPTPSPVANSPTSLSPDTVPIVESLPELSPPHTIVTLPDPLHAVLHYERTAALPSTNVLDVWSDTHKLVFAPLPGKLYLPNGNEQLLRVGYRYTHDDGSITRFISKVTYNTARVLAYLHTLHRSYPLYYFWKEQDLVAPRRELQKFVELYCKVEGVPAGVELDEDDEEYPPHIPPSKKIARVQLPHASALIEHYHKAAVEGVPFTAYLAKLEDPLETHTFEFVIYFFPQNPTLAYYVHRTDEDGDKVTNQVATFDHDEQKNGLRFQDLTSLEKLALVLFVLPAAAFKKYRCTGKLNVFGFDFPTFNHLENLDHYRPVPLHLSVVTDEHPSITSLFA